MQCDFADMRRRMVCRDITGGVEATILASRARRFALMMAQDDEFVERRLRRHAASYRHYCPCFTIFTLQPVAYHEPPAPTPPHSLSLRAHEYDDCLTFPQMLIGHFAILLWAIIATATAFCYTRDERMIATMLRFIAESPQHMRCLRVTASTMILRHEGFRDQ